MEFKSDKWRLVETQEELIKVCGILDKEKIIAIDLENHHLDSYNGHLCLI